MSLRLIVDGYEYTPDVFTFPGGEVNVNFLNTNKGLRKMPSVSRIVVEAKLRNSDDVMALLLLSDALDVWLVHGGARVDLVIPYPPYARQDRVCNKGEAHSLRVMCNLINQMDFNTVTVYDPHSIVTEALIDNVIVKDQVDILESDIGLSNKLRAGNYVIVSPDSGAEKKAMKVAQYFGCDMIRATKRRDMATGKIQEIGLIDPIPRGRSFLIVDDICDGGGTFIPLASELGGRDHKVELYITHGIFSKGTQILLDHFDTIYTTDSFYEGQSDRNIKVIKL